jgi:hypothetical protein
MTTHIFTLAPGDHSHDPVELENGYKLWSTFKRDWDDHIIYVRSNNPETAGGQTWQIIAHRADDNSPWYIQGGQGYFAQGGALLAGWLKSLGSRFRSEAKPYPHVKFYKATAKVYSLPSLLNGGKAVVSRDKQADERRARQRVDIAAAMAARKATQ